MTEHLRVLVTGGSGFIGTNLCHLLGTLPEVESLLEVDIKAPRCACDRHNHQRLDVLDEAALRDTIEQFQATHVVHLAARTDLRGLTISDYEVNYVGVENLISALNAVSSSARCLFFSSRLVFKIDSPPRSTFDYSATTLYGISKVVSEIAVRGWSGDWVLVRPTSIWGPWFETPYRDFFEMVRRRRYVHPAPRREIRKQFGYVENATYIMSQLMKAPMEQVSGRVFWLSDYEPIEVGSWADAIAKECAVPPVRSLNVHLLRAAARLGDVIDSIGRPAPLTSFRLNNLLTDMTYDVSDTERVCGPLPFSWREATERTVAWAMSPDGQVSTSRVG
jgi:nucleoside-diphosphate-sugar epimerase